MTEQVLPSNKESLKRRQLLRLGGVAAVAMTLEATGLAMFDWHTIRGWFTTSGGPYLNPVWHNTPNETSDSNWTIFPGDPSAAGKWQRDWHAVGLIGTDTTKFNKMQQEHPGGIQAVAFDPGGSGNIQVGIDYDGKSFYGIDENDPNQYIAGARLGAGEVKFAQGLYLPRLGSFVVAKTVAVGSANTATMAQDVPGAWYV